MRARHNKPLVDALVQLGAHLESTNDGYLPTRVNYTGTGTGTVALRGPVQVPSDISSQYLTSLLIIAPRVISSSPTQITAGAEGP